MFAGDKLGNLGVCDCSQEAVSAEEDEEDEEGSDPAVTTFKIHTRAISAFRFCPADGNKLFSCSYDSTIRKLDLEKAVSVEVYSPSDSSADEPISGVEVSPTSPETVYYSTLDGRFAILDCRVPSSSGRQVLRLSDKKIGGFSVHPGAPHIVATASLDRMLKLWDLRKISGKGDWRLPTLVGEHESRLSVSHAAFNAAGQVATASYDDTVKIYDFPSATTWSPGTTLSDAEMKPSAIVRHNNQTGRWVTM